jgi:enhancing lycopene biosynthesis protein 2
MDMPRVAVCLSGCGFLDGTEIHEAVLTLLALDQAGAQIICCAPNVDQAGVTNHLNKAPAAGERRNVLVESARIARGDIVDLARLRTADVDAIIFPGGYGAATNLSTFGKQGPECSVNAEVERVVKEMLAARKPIGVICIAPAMLARIVGRQAPGAKLTIGTDRDTAAAVERMGAAHVSCAVAGIVVDEKNRIVSTPAYMLGKGPAAVFEGIRKLVAEVLRLAKP